MEHRLWCYRYSAVRDSECFHTQVRVSFLLYLLKLKNLRAGDEQSSTTLIDYSFPDWDEAKKEEGISSLLKFFVTGARLLDDGCDDACADGTTAFANSETHSFFDCYRCNQFNFHADVVARHDHFNAGRQCD